MKGFYPFHLFFERKSKHILHKYNIKLSVNFEANFTSLFLSATYLEEIFLSHKILHKLCISWISDQNSTNILKYIYVCISRIGPLLVTHADKPAIMKETVLKLFCSVLCVCVCVCVSGHKSMAAMRADVRTKVSKSFLPRFLTEKAEIWQKCPNGGESM